MDRLLGTYDDPAHSVETARLSLFRTEANPTLELTVD